MVWEAALQLDQPAAHLLKLKTPESTGITIHRFTDEEHGPDDPEATLKAIITLSSTCSDSRRVAKRVSKTVGIEMTVFGATIPSISDEGPNNPGPTLQQPSIYIDTANDLAVISAK